MTPLGFHLALLPIDPRLGKMLIYASIFSCIDPILTIAASMSLKSPFQAPMDKKREADAAKRMFSRDEQVQKILLWRVSLNARARACSLNVTWVCCVLTTVCGCRLFLLRRTVRPPCDLLRL